MFLSVADVEKPELNKNAGLLTNNYDSTSKLLPDFDANEEYDVGMCNMSLLF